MADNNFLIAEVVVDLPVEGPFDYAVPDRLRQVARPGQRVSVVFNRKKRAGFVTGIKEHSDFERLNWVLAVLDEGGVAVDAPAIELAGALRGRYGCSLGEAIACCLPPLARQNRELSCPERGIAPPLPGRSPETVLVHGVDEEKSFEHIKERIEAALGRGQNVLVLVPEVHEVGWMVDRLKAGLKEAVYGSGKKLTVARAREEWRAARRGEFRVWVGTRSAVFTQLARLGLIVMFQEEHDSFREEQPPHYHARSVAVMRQGVEGCDIIFWSLAPSVELWQYVDAGRARKISFTREAADFKIVDMTNYNPRKTPLIAAPTQNSMRACLDDGGRVLLIVSAGDFHSWTHPREGGEIRAKAEKIEDEVRRYYSDVPFERCDDPKIGFRPRGRIVLASAAVLKSRRRWRPEMIGFLRPDARMHHFDYRSSQKMFALFIQLRLWARNTVVVQTMLRDQHAIRSAETWNFDGFYREEARVRQDLELPPAFGMVSVTCRGAKSDRVETGAERIYKALIMNLPESVRVAHPFRRNDGRSREQEVSIIICKGPAVESMVGAIKKILAGTKRVSGVVTAMIVEE
jgi:primosomal protein N'